MRDTILNFACSCKSPIQYTLKESRFEMENYRILTTNNIYLHTSDAHKLSIISNIFLHSMKQKTVQTVYRFCTE